jgi:hypothetical protein
LLCHRRIEREYEQDQKKERRRTAAATLRWDREDAKRERRQWFDLWGLSEEQKVGSPFTPSQVITEGKACSFNPFCGFST